MDKYTYEVKKDNEHQCHVNIEGALNMNVIEEIKEKISKTIDLYKLIYFNFFCNSNSDLTIIQVILSLANSGFPGKKIYFTIEGDDEIKTLYSKAGININNLNVI